jgi:hypothetical protein
LQCGAAVQQAAAQAFPGIPAEPTGTREVVGNGGSRIHSAEPLILWIGLQLGEARRGAPKVEFNPYGSP